MLANFPCTSWSRRIRDFSFTGTQKNLSSIIHGFSQKPWHVSPCSSAFIPERPKDSRSIPAFASRNGGELYKITLEVSVREEIKLHYQAAMKHLLKNAHLALQFACCFVIKHRTLGQSDYLQYNVIWLTFTKPAKNVWKSSRKSESF